MRLDVFGVLGDPDAATLTPALRLEDVRLVFLGARERLEVALTASNIRYFFLMRINRVKHCFVAYSLKEETYSFVKSTIKINHTQPHST